MVGADSRVNFEIAGDGASDLDLHLYRSDGTVITKSTSYTSDEAINTCLKAATYYVKVNGYGHAKSDYLLWYDKTAEACNTTCTDDAAEALELQGRTAVFAGWDGEVRGVLAVADTVAENAAETVAALRGMGLRVAMITGDARAVAGTPNRSITGWVQWCPVRIATPSLSTMVPTSWA